MAVSEELIRAARSSDADGSLSAANERPSLTQGGDVAIATKPFLRLWFVQHRLTLGPQASDECRVGSAVPKSAEQVPQVRRHSTQLQIAHADDLDGG